MTLRCQVLWFTNHYLFTTEFPTRLFSSWTSLGAVFESFIVILSAIFFLLKVHLLKICEILWNLNFFILFISLNAPIRRGMFLMIAKIPFSSRQIAPECCAFYLMLQPLLLIYVVLQCEHISITISGIRPAYQDLRFQLARTLWKNILKLWLMKDCSEGRRKHLI